MRFKDRAPDQLDDLGDDCVAESLQSGFVHSGGNPIIHSTKRGFSRPLPGLDRGERTGEGSEQSPVAAWGELAPSSFIPPPRAIGDGLRRGLSQSVAHGVGIIRPNFGAPPRPVPPSPRAQSVRLTPGCALLVAVFLEPAPNASVATGVGSNDPDSVAPMRRTNGGSRYAVPLRVIPERGQIAEYVSMPSTKQCCDVLHEHVPGSNVANDAGELAP